MAATCRCTATRRPSTCARSSAGRIPSTRAITLEIYAGTARHDLHHNGLLVQTFQPELTAQQTQVLDLLGIPTTNYTNTGPR